jgi:protein involved in polysaccharide export with SLBB domain
MNPRFLLLSLAVLFVSVPAFAQSTVRPYAIKLTRLAAGDALTITLTTDPDPVYPLYSRATHFSLRVVIRKDGTLTAPILGEIPAAGLTMVELQEKLQRSYADRHPYADYMPHVTLQFIPPTEKTPIDKIIENAWR